MNAPTSVRAAVLQALHAAGGDGLTADELAIAVSQLRDGASVRRVSVIGAVSDLNLTKAAVIVSMPTGRTQRYTLASVANRPSRRFGIEQTPTQEPERLPVAQHTSITAMAFGDPLPGRSALDQRLREGATHVAR